MTRVKPTDAAAVVLSQAENYAQPEREDNRVAEQLTAEG